MNCPFIAFNAGRQYTQAGQRIAAAVKGGRCHFVDIDRQVVGSFECAPGAELSRELVMVNYDHCNYVGSVDMDLFYELRAAAEEVQS